MPTADDAILFSLVDIYRRVWSELKISWSEAEQTTTPPHGHTFFFFPHITEKIKIRFFLS